MHRNTVLSIFILLGLSPLLLPVAMADTYVSGMQAGTWITEGSPYVVTGNITVPTGGLLTIEPGVEVLFQGTFQIYTDGGIIHAIGTAEDSIYFKPAPGYTQWGSLRMENTSAANPSIFKYCYMEHANGSPLNSRWGGVFWVDYGSIIVEHCSMWYNAAYTGVVMYAAFSNITIDSCEMYYGESEWCHGALGFHGCTGTVSYTTMAHNYCVAWGAGAYAWEGNMHFDHCTIANNTAGQVGGGLVVYPSSTTAYVDNCIIWGNAPANIYSVGNPVITYSDIGGGWAGIGNINADPLFVDPTANDYHLEQGSPCIDAGNPATPWDPDGTPPDMGAYFFDQGGPTNLLALYFEPVSPPIFVPPQGGSFNYTAAIYCDPSGYSIFDAWTDVTLPDGQVVGPLCIHPDLFLSAADSILRQMQLYVSIWAMPGTYEFHAYLGDYPDSVWVEDFFTFTKQPMGGNMVGPCEAYITISGWDKTELHYLPAWDGYQTIQSYDLRLGNSPEPFNPETVFQFSLPSDGNVRLMIYDLNGRLVGTLLNRFMAAGSYEEVWDAENMPSGLYLARLVTPAGTRTERCMLVK